MRPASLLQRALLPVLALGLASCAQAPVFASGESPIVDGERTDNDEPAVVLVVNRRGGLCTGTLIAPRVVLTAKHCVQRSGASGPDDARLFVIGIGDSRNRLTATHSVVSVWTTPGPYYDDGSLTGLPGVDVALITLQREAGVTPMSVYRGHPRDYLGQPVRAVGFGQIRNGDSGVKYRVTTHINGIDGNVLSTPPATCQGDSGGPLITEDNEVVGVTSFGSGACGSGGFNGYNRIDIFLEDIDRVLMETGICAGSAVELCNGMDDDCDDEVDEGCLDLGETCAGDDECASTRCEDTPGGRICTRECDTLRPELGCGPGLYCAQTAGCEGLCLLRDLPGAGAGDGESCAVDTDCASLFCTSVLGELRCASPCRGGEGMCFDGEDCAAPTDGCGACVDESIFAEPAGLGEACDGDRGCTSGMCRNEPDDSYCSETCTNDADCPSAFHCRDDVDVCIRGSRGNVGGNCAENGDCAASLFCATQGDTRWCTQFCETASECPDNFSCVAVGEHSVCSPDLGTTGSECAFPADCVSGVCEPLGPEDALVCSRMCSSDAPCETSLVCRRGSAAEGWCVSPSNDPDTTSPPTVPFLESAGGCAATPTGQSSLAFLLMLVIGGLAARRRWRS